MVHRTSSDVLIEMAKGFPAVAIMGPRQCGKTTLAKMLFPDKPYVSLENPDFRRHATGDSRDFLETYRDGAILDEIQYAPELLSYLQEVLDSQPDVMGRFILTGSRQFSIMEGLTQSLAGRIGILTLAPFSLAEAYGEHGQIPGLHEVLFRGLFPPVHSRPVAPSLWYPSYVQTYLERDVRQQIHIQDLGRFETFLRLVTGRSGQELNCLQLGNDAGISHNTAKSWISVLQAAGLVYLLPPYFNNFRKRLVKSPKLYLCDTGLLCWLLGIETPAQLRTHSAIGAIFETFVVMEFLKERIFRGQTPNLYFWRDQGQLEIDLLVPEGDRVRPIEIKSGKTYQREWSEPMRTWCSRVGDAALPGILFYGGDARMSDSGIEIRPWNNLFS